VIPALITLSVVTSVLGCYPEARDTWRGLRNPDDPRAARPVVMSWVIWTAILAIGGAASALTGQLPAAVFTLAQAAECGLVAVLAMCIPVAQRDEPARVPLGGRGVRLDMLCLPGAVTGLVLLAVLRAPAPAVAVSIGTDVLAYVPTVSHSWRQPYSEAWDSYGWYAVSAAAALAAARHLTITAVGYPAWLVLAETVTTTVIVCRRSVTVSPARALQVPHARGQPPPIPVAYGQPVRKAGVAPRSAGRHRRPHSAWLRLAGSRSPQSSSRK
jgi:hypothetical protein